MTCDTVTRSADAERDTRLLRRDVNELVKFDRRTAGFGEQDSARYLVGRLAELGAKDIGRSAFRTQSSWAPTHLTYLALGIELALLSHPAARIAGAALAVAYELEVSGRIRWVKRMLPARRGISVHARIPAAGETKRTVVLVAHHDAAHMGVVWDPRAVAASRVLVKTTGRALPSHLLPLVALAALALPSRRVRAGAAAVAATGSALMLQSMRSGTAPGANDNASGVAAVLEVTRRLIRNPLPNTTILVVFPGAEEATNGGIRDWLHANRRRLDPSTTLVVNLDAVGSNGPVAVARREALTNRLDENAVNRTVRAAAELDLAIEEITIPNATDAAVMTVAGLPTVSLLSVEDGWISNLHRPSDTVDDVNWATVRDAVALTERLVSTWAIEQPRHQD